MTSVLLLSIFTANTSLAMITMTHVGSLLTALLLVISLQVVALMNMTESLLWKEIEVINTVEKKVIASQLIITNNNLCWKFVLVR